MPTHTHIKNPIRNIPKCQFCNCEIISWVVGLQLIFKCYFKNIFLELLELSTIKMYFFIIREVICITFKKFHQIIPSSKKPERKKLNQFSEEKDGSVHP